jgi:hypothetical protein
MLVPPGFRELLKASPSDVCHIRKSLYGLKQAPRIFKELLSEKLLLYGLTELEDGLWSLKNSTLRVFVYVDDLAIAGSDNDIQRLVDYLQAEFSLKTEPVNRILGIEIETIWKDNSKSEFGYLLHQTSYISNIIQRLEEAIELPILYRKSQVPLIEKLEKHKTDIKLDKRRAEIYRSKVAEILYTSLSVRPDLAYAVSSLSQYNNDPTDVAWKALLNVCGYLSQTKSFGLKILRHSTNSSTIYTDSDHNSDQDLVSRIAYIGQAFGNTVSWKSRKLANIISMSSCESEFYAAELGGKDGIYIRRLQYSLITGRSPECEEEMKPCTMLIDNQAAIQVLKQDGFNNRTKHIDVRYLWIKTEVKKERLTPSYIPTNMNIADALTKPLKRNHLFKLMTLAGMGVINGGECNDLKSSDVIALTTAKPTQSNRSSFKVHHVLTQPMFKEAHIKQLFLSLHAELAETSSHTIWR